MVVLREGRVGRISGARWFFVRSRVNCAPVGRSEVICTMTIRYLVQALVVICGGLGLFGCAPEPQVTSEMPSPAPTLAVSQAANTPTPATPADTGAGGHESATVPGAVVNQTAVNCESGAVGAAPHYGIEADMDWATHTLDIKQTVAFVNDSGRTLNSLLFNVEPNRVPGQFALMDLSLGDSQRLADFRLEDTVLTVLLDRPLPDGCQISVAMDFTLVLGEIAAGYRMGHLGYLGYSPRQVNLGMWFPLLAAFDKNGEWMILAPHDIGEQSVLRTAHFSVDLAVSNAPENIRVAGPGEVVRPGKLKWRFELDDARDITLSISDAFHLLTTSTASDVGVELYYFEDTSAANIDAARHALTTAADALGLFEELFGSYPYERMVVVQGDFPDGMEFSGLVFVSEAWFRTWKGVPDDWLTLITVHEVSHQWWYALVANDQANAPYVDEALAIYCEALYLERYYPQLVDWWWAFRVSAYSPTGFVDSAVYEFHTPRSYINAVYLRGAMMVQALRNDLGDKAFFAWLRAYAEQQKGKVVSPADLWGVLATEDYLRTESTRSLYLKQPAAFGTESELP